MGYVNKISVGNGTHLIEPTLYAITGGTASAITASISNFEAVEGVVISLNISTANSASATLNVNNNGAKTIRYNGAIIPADLLQVGHIYSFVYNSSNNVYYWDLIGDLSFDTKIELVDFWEAT